MRIILQVWLTLMAISLTACTTVFSDEGSQTLRLPMGVGFGVSDALCKEVKNVSIPKRLEKLKIPFEWTNQTERLLFVGPFVEASGGIYKKVRQSFFLTIVCDDELTTSISGDAIIEGLNDTGQWIGITDLATIAHHSMAFVKRLDL